MAVSVLQSVSTGASGLGRRGFYAELTTRNAGVITPADQERLRTATIVIAGCGSIGGAAAEPLARIGATRLRLADPGEYEVNNLNRQNATAGDIGRNKAEVAAERIRAINPHADVAVVPEGITRATVRALLAGADLVIDGVDVTTDSGLRAKVLLHEHAHALGLPLFTGWDMAGAQYVRVYDYRKGGAALDGRLTEGELDRLSNWQILQRLVPARFVPHEMVRIAGENLGNADFSFPQLVHAADLFGALSAHLVGELLADRPVRTHTYIDLHQAVRPLPDQLLVAGKRAIAAARLLLRIRGLAA